MIRNNSIEANGAVIRIGLGMGPHVWICLPENSTKDTIYGGIVSGNTLGGEGMQSGYAVDGVRGWTVTDNIDEVIHTGSPSVDCRGEPHQGPPFSRSSLAGTSHVPTRIC